MLEPHTAALKGYLFGLACTLAGAWLTAATGSMLPLALGAAAWLMTTVPLIRSIWRKGHKGGRGD